MREIFVNLKRFDVPRSMGGVCPADDPGAWVEGIIDKSYELGLGKLADMQLVYMLPEALIIPAGRKLCSLPEAGRKTLHIGCQSVFREDVKAGGNFGAFTTNLPASAAKNMGCGGTIIGHSEERKDKQGIIGAFASEWNSDDNTRARVMSAVDGLLNQQVLCALHKDMHVLFCVGETAEERGDGGFEEQKKRIESILLGQLERGLKGIEAYPGQWNIVIGYEPVWAIGPGKIPPGKEYISFVSELIKKLGERLYNREFPVVYGGGLKRENAAMISSIPTLDGGLVALTRFTGEIGFSVEELRDIIDEYVGAAI